MSMSTEATPVIEPLSEREIALASGKAYSDLDVSNEPEAVETESSDMVSPVVEEKTPPPADDKQDAATDTEVGSGGGKEAAQTKPDTAWLNDELKGFGKSWGLSEEQMSKFRDGDELLRHGMMFDQGKVKPEPSKPAVDPAAPAVDPEGKKPEPGETTKVDNNGLVDVKFYEENGYDEPTVNIVKALRSEQEANRGFRDRLSGLEQRQQKQDFEDAAADFDKTLDEMYPEFLGVSKSEKGIDAATAEKRIKVWRQLGEIEKGIVEDAKSRNLKPEQVEWPTKEILYRRAALAAHGEEVLKMERERIYGKLQKQEKKGRPAPSRSAPRPNVPAEKQVEETMEESAKRIAADPKIAKFFEEQSMESGMD